MNGIIEFGYARLDEEEAAANAGARRVGMPWRAEPQPGTSGGLVIDNLGLVGSTGGRYAAEHIARNDPARVLRDIEGKRAILVEHLNYGGSCRICINWPPDPYPCRTVRLLIARWDDHPGYDQGWKP